MTFGRILYRVSQFQRAIWDLPAPAELEQAREVLTPKQMELFNRMQPSEQAHCLQVFKQVKARGERQQLSGFQDLLVAALLHDVGKSRHSLRLWERVFVVLAKACCPVLVRWGNSKLQHAAPGEYGDSLLQEGQISGWRRPFIIAEQHPIWGAEMAAGAGVSPLAVALIRRHQNFLETDPVSIEDQLLQILQAVDGVN